jgi:hypothetical protein
MNQIDEKWRARQESAVRFVVGSAEATSRGLTQTTSILAQIRCGDVKWLLKWAVIVGLFAWLLIGMIALWPSTARGEWDPVPQAPQAVAPAPALSPAAVTSLEIAVIGLGLTALAAALAEAAEAAVAVTAGVAAGGGLVTVATLAAVTAVITVVVAAVVVSAVIVAPALVAEIRARHAVQAPSVGTGEQTDDMHQATQQAADLAANPQGVLSFPFSGRGHDVDLENQIEAVINNATGGLTIGDVPGAPPGSVPGLGLGLGLSLSPTTPSNPIASDLVDVPGAMPDPGAINVPESGPAPGGFPDAPSCCGDGGMGLMAFEPGPERPERAVPSIPTWLMWLMGLGVGGWALRRRYV